MQSKSTREMSWVLDGSSETTGEYIKGKTITTGSLKRSVWKLWPPLVLISLCFALIRLVHVMCAGYVSNGAQAIIGICDLYLSLGYIILVSLSSAASAFVSRCAGKDSIKEIADSTGQALRLCFLTGVVLALVLRFSADYVLIPFSGCVEDCDQTLSFGVAYLDYAAFSLIPYGALTAINAAFLGMGQSRVKLITIVTLAVIDIGITYCLLVLNWPANNLGIKAIGIASLIGTSVASLLALLMLAVSPLKAAFSALLSKRNTVANGIIATGIPAALQDMCWSLSEFVLYYILKMVPDSTSVVAALNIGQRLESMVTFPLTALGSTMIVITGQNLGARRLNRAFRSSVGALAGAAAVMAVAGLVLFFFANHVAAAGNASAETLPFVVNYLKFAAIGLVFVGFDLVVAGILQALHDTKIPMIINFATTWLVSLPLMYLLAVKLNMGANGIWLSILLANITLGSSELIRFFLNPEWKHLKSKKGTNSGDQDEDTLLLEPDDEVLDANAQHVSRGRPCQEIKRMIPEPTPDESDPSQ